MGNSELETLKAKYDELEKKCTGLELKIAEQTPYRDKLRADLSLAIEALKKAKDEMWREHHADACAPAGYKIIKETLAKLLQGDKK